MAKEYQCLIGGKWRSTAEKLEVKNPYNGEVVGVVSRANPNDLDEAISGAVKAFEVTRELPTFKRAEFLGKIVKGLTERSEEIARMISMEAGKPIRDARGEVGRAISTFTIAMEESKRIGGEVIPLDINAASAGRVAITRRFPIGPIAGISPFNFPLNLMCHKVAPALASGNTIVHKPASAVPITAILLGEIAMEAGVPGGAFNVVPCSGSVGERLATDDRIKMVTFTGSDPVGWHLKSVCGKKRITLELGGDAGVIVHSDADLPYAVNRCVTGAFSYSGQVCISVQKIFVHEPIFDDFVGSFIEKTKTLKVGDPLDEATDIGPMIDLDNARRVESWVDEAVSAGAKVLAGGVREGSLYHPTVLTNVTPDMKVSCFEVFAPVVSIVPYQDYKDALAKINNTRFGLQAGIFTRDVKQIFEAFHKVEVGGLIVNDVPTYRVDHMPYGGTKDSGMGREGLKYAIEEMTEVKIMALNLA
ncbi:MAG: aldehyde dehydrogenase family protein [Candidatus Tectomicrobia bacterium]|nr:aldehyde dehydrogenase family protein [Candidatus Tectomicrobia bacterium]